MAIGRYTQQGVQSKLISLSSADDIKRLVVLIEQNLDIIWRALNDLRNRVDTLQNK